MAKEMNWILVANGIGLSAPAFEPSVEGRTCLERLAEYARALPGAGGAALPGAGRLILLADERLPGSAAVPSPFRVVKRPAWTVGELLAVLRAEAAEAAAEHLLYVYADCPLLDPGLARRMLDNHRRYSADYTFADGYPYGLAPEILRAGILPALAVLAGQGTDEVRRDTLFELVRRDINAFDLETEISPEDLRLLRVSLTADTRRNLLLLRRVAEKGGRDVSSVCRVLKESPEILRTLPAFFNVQIVEGEPQAGLWSPYAGFGPPGCSPAPGKIGEMPPARFDRLAGDIQAFCGDAVVSVSLWGETAWHSRFPEVAAAVLGRPGLRLVVETSGLGWSADTLEAVRAAARGWPAGGQEASGGRLDWIVFLDAHSPEVYRRIRGEGFEEARAAVARLLELFPGRVYVQAVRMRENEEDLEAFYREWKATAARVIIQKYDHFCGELPDRKVADLSPLKRFPCWHLKRDVYVLLDGTVPLCREDLRRRHRLGNVFEDGLEGVWKAQERFYLDHLREDYPELCRNCDEYYTYNF